MRLSTRLFAYSAILFAFHSGSAANAPRPTIGVVLSPGKFQVAHVWVSGTATVLSGDEVQSTDLTSRIMLKDGGEFALVPHSSGSFYQDHANLLDGEMHLKSSAPFYITSRNFTVTPIAPGTQAILQTNGSTLSVRLDSGAAKVTLSNGETLAHMTAGTTLAFNSVAPAAAGGAPARETNVSNTSVHLLGVLTAENGHYLLRDRYTNNVFEVSGSVESKLVSHLVMVDGTWMGNQKSPISQVDHFVQASHVALSDATTAVPCRPDGAGGVLKSIVLDGVLSRVRNHFLVKDAKRGTYEVVGDVADKEIGTDLHEKGFILPDRTPILPAEKVVYLERRKFAAFASPCVGSMLAGTIVTTGLLVPKDTGRAPVVKNPISF